MKTAWWMVIVAAFLSQEVNAQYVTIPDSIFAEYLEDLYPNCMVGNQMDTSCIEITTEDFLDVSFLGIASLNGVKYFDNLFTLWCSNNLIDSLSQLPQTLDILICSGNPLTSLPLLPNTLSDLNCSFCQLTDLPALPESLNYLNCSYNELSILPSLPELGALYCQHNQLSYLPFLPPALISLVCSNNNLFELPALPSSLFEFLVDSNPQLGCLPPLVNYFGDESEFSISGTQINCLPNVINHIGYIAAIDTMPICELINPNGCEIGWNILGETFNDGNADCLEIGEVGLKNIKLFASLNDTVFQQFISTAAGLFSFQLPLDTYELTIDTAALPFNVFCPSDNVHTSSLDASSFTDSAANFALQCKPGFDLGVNALVGTDGFFFPGGIATVKIAAGDISSYYGIHCSTIGLTGTVIASVNGLVTISSVSSGGLVSGNQITWNIADFSTVDFENDFSLQLTTDTSAQAGDEVCITVTVSASTGTDNNPLNDTLTHCFTVVNSYDPNIKEVYPATVSEPGGWHTYTIHFQNTGTAAAQNIVVKDTLDANLDWSSFQLLAYSHENLTQLLQNGADAIVHFNFPNINLPDSNSNEPDSHGFIQYRIKTDSTIAYGTEIHNTAAIYFDFNEPVITNDALVVYEQPENVATTFSSTNAFSLYPNPASNDVTIKLLSTANAFRHGGQVVEVTDLTGKVLFSVSTEKLQTKLSIENLSSGSYLVRLMENDRAIGVKKLVVIR